MALSVEGAMTDVDIPLEPNLNLNRRSKIFRTFRIKNYSSLLVRILSSNFLGRNLFDLSGSKYFKTFWVESFSNSLDRFFFEFSRSEIFWNFWFENSLNFFYPKFFKLSGTKISFSVSIHFAKFFDQGNKNNFRKKSFRLRKLEYFSDQKTLKKIRNKATITGRLKNFDSESKNFLFKK